MSGTTRTAMTIVLVFPCLCGCVRSAGLAGCGARRDSAQALYDHYSALKGRVKSLQGNEQRFALGDLRDATYGMFFDVTYGFKDSALQSGVEADEYFVDCLYSVVLSDEMYIVAAMKRRGAEEGLSESLRRRIRTVVAMFPVSKPTLFAERAHFLVFLCRASKHVDRGYLEEVFERNESRWGESDRAPMLFFLSAWGVTSATTALGKIDSQETQSLRAIFDAQH